MGVGSGRAGNHAPPRTHVQNRGTRPDPDRARTGPGGGRGRKGKGSAGERETRGGSAGRGGRRFVYVFWLGVAPLNDFSMTRRRYAAPSLAPRHGDAPPPPSWPSWPRRGPPSTAEKSGKNKIVGRNYGVNIGIFGLTKSYATLCLKRKYRKKNGVMASQSK